MAFLYVDRNMKSYTVTLSSPSHALPTVTTRPYRFRGIFGYSSKLNLKNVGSQHRVRVYHIIEKDIYVFICIYFILIGIIIINANS